MADDTLLIATVDRSAKILNGSISVTLNTDGSQGTMDLTLIDFTPSIGDAISLGVPSYYSYFSGTVRAVTRTVTIPGHYYCRVSCQNDAGAVQNHGSSGVGITDGTPNYSTTFPFVSLSEETVEAEGNIIQDPTTRYIAVTDYRLTDAGFEITVTSSDLGLSAESLFISQINMTWPKRNHPRFQYTLGDAPDALTTTATQPSLVVAADGLDNAVFARGSVSTLPSGRTTALPGWTIATTGSPTVTRALSSSWPSGYYVEIVFSAVNDSVSLTSDLIPIKGGVPYGLGCITGWAKASGTAVWDAQLYARWYDADGNYLSQGSVGGGDLAPGSAASSMGPHLASFTEFSLTAPITARFVAFRITVTETVAHDTDANRQFRVGMARIGTTPVALDNAGYYDVDFLDVGTDLQVDGTAYINGPLIAEDEVSVGASSGANLNVYGQLWNTPGNYSNVAGMVAIPFSWSGTLPASGAIDMPYYPTRDQPTPVSRRRRSPWRSSGHQHRGCIGPHRWHPDGAGVQRQHVRLKGPTATIDAPRPHDGSASEALTASADFAAVTSFGALVTTSSFTPTTQSVRGVLWCAVAAPSHT